MNDIEKEIIENILMTCCHSAECYSGKCKFKRKSGCAKVLLRNSHFSHLGYKYGDRLIEMDDINYCYSVINSIKDEEIQHILKKE